MMYSVYRSNYFYCYIIFIHYFDLLYYTSFSIFIDTIIAYTFFTIYMSSVVYTSYRKLCYIFYDVIKLFILQKVVILNKDNVLITEYNYCIIFQVMFHSQLTYVNTFIPFLSYSGIYRPCKCVIGDINIAELSFTQLPAFMHIKSILDKMVPLADETSNLRLEDIPSDTDDEEVDFQVIFFSRNTYS